jgi:hypothetical protein
VRPVVWFVVVVWCCQCTHLRAYSKCHV